MQWLPESLDRKATERVAGMRLLRAFVRASAPGIRLPPVIMPAAADPFLASQARTNLMLRARSPPHTFELKPSGIFRQRPPNAIEQYTGVIFPSKWI
jgi:hypothetical protein